MAVSSGRNYSVLQENTCDMSRGKPSFCVLTVQGVYNKRASTLTLIIQVTTVTTAKWCKQLLPQTLVS
jgi:hypothetical protein